MFEDSTFESTGRIHTRSRRWMLATSAVNGSILLALVIIPLIYPEALPKHLINILLVAPPAPQAAPKPLMQPTQHPALGHTEFADLRLTAPTHIPIGIRTPAAPEPGPVGPQIAGFEPSTGIPGGDVFRHATAQVVSAKPQSNVPTRISSGVAAGLLINKTLPPYPAIAKAAGVQGTVELQAIISSDGTIQNLRVVSGSPMLQQAALDAVRNWRYRPYTLNGQPVAVETTIHVNFSLNR